MNGRRLEGGRKSSLVVENHEVPHPKGIFHIEEKPFLCWFFYFFPSYLNANGKRYIG